MRSRNFDFSYLSGFFGEKEAWELFAQIRQNIQWESREIRLFGRTYLQPRLIKWQGEMAYRYSGVSLPPKEYDLSVDLMRTRVENYLKIHFNGVLLNYYRDGSDSMGWHSDDEPELGAEPVIASVSLGATRKMVFRQRSDRSIKEELLLENGSLLIMRGSSQKDWQHAIPKTKKVTEGRINLTFRQIRQAV